LLGFCTFATRYLHHLQERTSMSSTVEIPCVDLSDLSSADAPTRMAAADAIRRGFGEYGLVYVSGHGIDPTRLSAFYDLFLELTALPLAEKERWARPDEWFQRGWTPPNTERAVVAGGQPDFKECWFAAPVPTAPEAAIHYPQIYAENVWPEGNDAFREAYLAIGVALHEVGRALLRGCATALSLPEATFDDAIVGGPHVTRALRYLPLDQEQVDANVAWGEEHTDFNLLTLLPGGRFIAPDGREAARPDDGSGLYLRTRATPDHPAGRMVQGVAPKGCIVAQVGQQLEILTGGTLLATPHVITAPRAPGWSRTSMAHFIHLESNQILFPLAEFRTPEVMRAYSPPVLAGTYASKTLVDIGLAPATALDGLGYRHYDRLAQQRTLV
jgi:isopenicillin N synthase-like dioxygenase